MRAVRESSLRAIAAQRVRASSVSRPTHLLLGGGRDALSSTLRLSQLENILSSQLVVSSQCEVRPCPYPPSGRLTRRFQVVADGEGTWCALPRRLLLHWPEMRVVSLRKLQLRRNASSLATNASCEFGGWTAGVCRGSKIHAVAGFQHANWLTSLALAEVGNSQTAFLST